MIQENLHDRDRLNFLLFMHNVRTVFSQAKAYMSKTNDFDSLVQNGMLGLAEAVRRFDPSRDVKFCTYANTWVHKYLSMPYYTSQYKLDMNTVSLSSPSQAVKDQDGSLSSEDTLENVVQDYVDPATKQVLYSIENEL
jgi:RNA polymerase sigma factor (sigma-70 family)